MLNILCFGDSITQGEGDALNGGWADRIKRDYFKQFELANHQEVHLYNLGIGGETTDGLKRRFETEYRARAMKNANNVVLFQYGINDIVIHKRKNIVPPDYFVRNLTHCIDFAVKAGSQVCLLNLLPISDDSDGIINQHGDLRHMQDVLEFNQLIEGLAGRLNCQLFDLYTPFNLDKSHLLTCDGLHPNTDGHKLLYRVITQELNNVL